jgi:hypothetical protein
MAGSVKISSKKTSGKSLLADGVRIVPLVSSQVISGNSFIHADVRPEFLLFSVKGKHYFFNLNGKCSENSVSELNDFLFLVESESSDILL